MIDEDSPRTRTASAHHGLPLFMLRASASSLSDFEDSTSPCFLVPQCWAIPPALPKPFLVRRGSPAAPRTPPPDVPSSCLQGPVGHRCHRILGLGVLFLSLRSSSCVLSLGPSSAIVPCEEWGCQPSQESCSLPGDIQLLGVLCLPYQHLETNEGLQGAFSDYEIIWLHYVSRKRENQNTPRTDG